MSGVACKEGLEDQPPRPTGVISEFWETPPDGVEPSLIWRSFFSALLLVLLSPLLACVGRLLSWSISMAFFYDEVHSSCHSEREISS